MNLKVLYLHQQEKINMPVLPSLHITNNMLSKDQLKDYSSKMSAEASILKRVSGYDDDRCSISLPSDKEIAKSTATLAKRHRKADAIIVVGIGGSNLGTMAVQEAVLGRLYNQSSRAQSGRAPKIFYADTVDAFSMKQLLELISGMLKEGKTVLVNGVSKSGSTTETTANFEILTDFLKKNDPNASEHIVVTSDEGSPFWNLAKARGYHVLNIPKKVGGRYSVFSAVGQYPLRVLGLDVDSLLNGAEAMKSECLSKDIFSNPAMQRAAILHHYYLYGKGIADMFLFASDLEAVGRWYRQLMAESIGKEWDAGKTRQVFCGMTPTVSIGSTDLHSMAQLYLGGPNDKFTTFVTVGSAPCIRVPQDKSYESLVPNIQGKRIARIMDAIFKGVSVAYEKSGRPFCHISLHDKDEYQIGALLQMHMIEMMHLGQLLGVNPFDQPAVEAYKVETKRILAGWP